MNTSLLTDAMEPNMIYYSLSTNKFNTGYTRLKKEMKIAKSSTYMYILSDIHNFLEKIKFTFDADLFMLNITYYALFNETVHQISKFCIYI